MQWADIAVEPRAEAGYVPEAEPSSQPVDIPADMRKASSRRIDHLKLMADMQNYFNITRSTAEYLRWRGKYDDFTLDLQNAIVRANSAIHWATLRKEFSLEGEELLLRKYYEKSGRVHRNTEDAGGWRIVTHKRRRNQRRALNRYLEHQEDDQPSANTDEANPDGEDE